VEDGLEMTQKATERITWAVETLAVAPNDHILEIGCGHGVAVSLVCEKLATGTITAIDRSQKMIEMAAKRNQGCVDAGKARLHCVTLEDADFGDQRFDKIFAIRVNFFIQQPERQLPKIKQLLKPNGLFYIFYDPPVTAQSASFITIATEGLGAYGFTVEQAIQKELGGTQVVCIMAVKNPQGA
jgi:ubiquinone/menaquinone biosynthesis C-methylase UbiE